MKRRYELLFENYAHKYDQECFVQGALGECSWLRKKCPIKIKSDHDGN